MTEPQLPWAFGFDVMLNGDLVASGEYFYTYEAAHEECVRELKRAEDDNGLAGSAAYGLVMSGLNWRGDHAICDSIYSHDGPVGSVSDEHFLELEAGYRRDLIVDNDGICPAEADGLFICSVCGRDENEHWLIDFDMEPELLCGDWSTVDTPRVWVRNGITDSEVVEHLITIGSSFDRHELAAFAERGWDKSLQSIMQGNLLDMRERLSG